MAFRISMKPASLLVLCGLLLAGTSAHARAMPHVYTNSFSEGRAVCGPDNHVVPCKAVNDPLAPDARDLVQFAVDKLNNVWSPLGKTMALKAGAVKLHESMPVAGTWHWLTAEVHDPSQRKWVLTLEILEALPFQRGTPETSRQLTQFKLSSA